MVYLRDSEVLFGWPFAVVGVASRGHSAQVAKPRIKTNDRVRSKLIAVYNELDLFPIEKFKLSQPRMR